MRLFSASTQVWLFLIITSLACLVVGYQLGSRLGLFIGLLIAISFHVFILFFGDTQLFNRVNAVPMKGQDSWNLNQRISDMSLRIGLKPPELSLVDSKSGLALAVGQPWGKGKLVISTGLLEKLSNTQLNSILAHQLGHLHHMDSFRFGVMAGIARLILGVANFMDKLWIPNFWLQRKQEPFLHAMSPFAWVMLRLAVSSKAYFQNDDLAIRLVGDRRALAEALWKLDGLSRSRPFELPPCTSHYFVVNPQDPKSRSRWLESHPAVNLRIRRLIGTDTI